MHQIKISHRVNFFETDKAGLVHFSNHYRYFEMAEAALFRGLNQGHLGLIWGADAEGVGFVRHKAEMEFISPARLDDELEIRVWVAEKNSRGLTLGCLISLNGRKVSRGWMETLCVTMDRPGHAKSCCVPPELDQALEVAPWGKSWPKD